MDSMYLSISLYFVVVITIPQTEAGIFDPIANMFVPPRDDNSIPGKVINSFISPFRDDPGMDEPGREFHPRPRNHRNPKAWWADNSTPRLPIIHNIFNERHTTPPDYDKIVANQFPQATALLDRLKELNKLKEQQKLHEGDGNYNKPHRPEQKPFDFEIQTKKPGDDIQENSTEQPPTDGNKVMRSITKRHFYFQAQPVRPEGEDESTSETIYYVDD